MLALVATVLLPACETEPPALVFDAGPDLVRPVDARLPDLASDGAAPIDASVPDLAVVDAAQGVVFGLDARPVNSTCRAFTAPPITAAVQLVDRFPNVPLDTPTGLFQRPGDDSRWYATERGGRVVYFPNDGAATAADLKVALDLRTVTFAGSDCSMSSISFPPDFATSKRAYVGYCYLGPETGNKLQLRLSRFATLDGGATFDKTSEQVLLAIDFPYDATHPTVGLHGLDVARFGADGYLYVSVGDGGPQGMGGGQQAQDPDDLRGKLLRLDVSDLSKGLSKDFVANRQRVAVDIPADNPFAVSGGHPAIFAYGFRNPWQWSFDRFTNKIWLGDVGFSTWEEVDRDVQSGGNYGWAVYEGFQCTNYFGAASCTDAALKPPLFQYGHGSTTQDGKAITGGRVYRGTAVPSLYGAYIFGDSSTARIWAVRNVDSIPDAPATPPTKELLFESAPVSSFAEDQDGELYLTILYSPGGYSGRVLSLQGVPAFPDPALGGPPAKLSDTGCFEQANPKNPLPALVPFAPAAELWSDGASKRRWFALPDGKQITVTPGGDLDFPTGSVLVKEFSVGTQRVETRFFVRQEADAHWAGYTYAWNEAQTDATLVGPTRSTVAVGAGVWNVPSRADCMQCHTKAAGTTLGPEVGQLNHQLFYPATGRYANQLATLDHLGFLDGLPPEPRPSLAAIEDTTRTLNERVRSYLHANCANCHRPDGPTFTPLDLRASATLAGMGICNVPPTIDSLEAEIQSDPRLLAAGDPLRSVLYWRMQSIDPAIRMPAIARTSTHAVAVDAVASWIAATTSCPP